MKVDQTLGHMAYVRLRELSFLSLVTEAKGDSLRTRYIYSKGMEPKMRNGKTSSSHKLVQFLAGC